MLRGKTIAVVVPAYNEEKQIAGVIKSMPDFVDRIVVISDASTDSTVAVVREIITNDKSNTINVNENKIPKLNKYNRAEVVAAKIMDSESVKFTPSEIVNKNNGTSRIVLISHLQNAGVGAAMATGYKWCRDHQIDCTAVMAGDGQMDPSELEKICTPVIDGEADYVKANRLSHRSALFVVPKVRFFGNSVLSLLTKIASGYWHVSDTQSGYTAISLDALKAIRLNKIFKSYGVPNDMLIKLNIAFCTIKEVGSKPVYDVGEVSKMNELKAIPKISWLLFRSFWIRLYSKYLFRDFHPLFLLYHFSFILAFLNIFILIRRMDN